MLGKAWGERSSMDSSSDGREGSGSETLRLIIFRQSIVTYLLERVIRIGSVISKNVWAFRGITAGSGFATTELMIIMLRIVDKACRLYPLIMPTLFVDDLAADATAPAAMVVTQLGGFIETVAEFISDTKQ